ncbi:hypothetical protein [Amycolatopsis rubida]|uniref:ARB-07466-like C-terminal domain-containing protein n=1 Tax=Amycolatopsis rubida TaxID=112413 RepID=A0A1I6BJZ2_9PSEU|nr:hypothetical protein [Amycolatopsis rubida]SFQ81117.1 hypothetical protein SAMN05421854_12916 [Amycolatopsis rubida]
MSGRHRDGSKSWRLPAAAGALAAGALAVPVWLAASSAEPEQFPAAAAEMHAFSAPRPSSSVPSTASTPPARSSSAAPATSSSSSPTSETTPRASETPAAKACSSTLAGTRPAVARAGNFLKEKFSVDTVGGRAGRSGASDHPAGLALDFMVDPKTGNALAAYVLAHQDELGAKYVIWQQRYNDGSGWSAMEDRGGETANHYDHVHVSFERGAKVSLTC